MKSLLTCLIVCGIALMAASTSRADEQTTPAKVVRIKGSARYTTDEHTWHPLELGQIIKPGTVIQTGENSMVDIILGDGEVDQNPQPMGSSISYNPHAEQDLVRLWDNTTMGIDKLTRMQTGADTMTDTQLDLRAGSVFGTVTKISPTSKYEVKIPNGVAGIRGTIYLINSAGMVAVLQGAVLVAYMDASGNPQTKEVGKGYEFNTKTGEMRPLSELHLRDLLLLAWQARLVINQPVTITTDHTTVEVSPIKSSPPPP